MPSEMAAALEIHSRRPRNNNRSRGTFLYSFGVAMNVSGPPLAGAASLLPCIPGGFPFKQRQVGPLLSRRNEQKWSISLEVIAS
jgi:hypothetical protein